MTKRLCRWGIISTALIGQKNWQAIHLSGNGTVVGVASRDPNNARDFIERCQSRCPYETPPTVFDDYQSLLGSDQIDAVYIPLPTALRKPWVIAAANAGKHVVCEKPCAADADDLQEMIGACRENNVQFMDGVMYMHTQRMKRIRAALDDPQNVGAIKRIACQFSFCAPDDWMQSDIRVNSELEPHGCLGDLGWYCIRFALWTMNWQLPQRVTATMLAEHSRADSPQPVPVEFSAELFFPDGVSAGFYCSFRTHHQQWANISGSRGYLYIPDFVLPYKGDQLSFEISNADFVIDGCDFHMDDHRQRISVPESANSTANSQETNLFRTFGDLVLSGSTDPHWPEISLKTQQVMDACFVAAKQEQRSGQLVS